jgi:multidrug efflux system membrane fusion protein
MRRFTSRSSLIALGTIALAVAAALLSASWVGRHPSSSDASIDADVVHVAAAGGGRIIDIRVR